MTTPLLKMAVLQFAPFVEAGTEPVKYIEMSYTVEFPNADTVGVGVVRVGGTPMSAESFLAVADAVRRFYRDVPLNKP